MKDLERNTVLVTGASSGIGRATVGRMIAAGWRVFASVRRPEDAAELTAQFGTDVTPVIIDVKDRDTMWAAAEAITTRLSGRALGGLVNVAGIGMARPIEYVTPEELHEIFEINVFGQIALTQAFLPLLRKALGRIVNISSVGAHIAIPFGSLINASKAAFGMFSDTLRMELRPFGIRVSTVEPAAIATPAVEKTLGSIEAVISTLPPDGAAEYGDMLREFARRAYVREMNGSSPDVVAGAIHHALTSKRPRARYRVGKHARLLTTLPRVLPDALLEQLLLRVAGMPTQFGSRTGARAKLRHRVA